MPIKVLSSLLVAILTGSLTCAEVLCQHQGAESLSDQTVASYEQITTAIRFKTLTYIDEQGIGIEAFQIFVPYDWQFEGGIRWVLDNPGMPAVASFRVWNPSGTEEFEVFPTQPFFWTNN